MQLKHYVNKIPYLSVITRIARKKKCGVWLVGGFLRDYYLQKTGVRKKNVRSNDFDFCVEKETRTFAREFAQAIGSRYIILDEQKESYRIVSKKRKGIYRYDFILMRGAALKEDLSLRDFTINTLALSLHGKRNLIQDYFCAREDIRRKIIRVTQKRAFLDDPLRILRGFTFGTHYGFTLEPRTKRAMVQYKRQLHNVAGERISEELFKLLASDYSIRAFLDMEKGRIFDEIIPFIRQMRGIYQGRYHHLDVWKHSLETLRTFEILYRRKLARDEKINEYLNEPLGQRGNRLQLIKLACLLHDVGKPFAKKRKGRKTIFHTHEKIGRDLAEEIGQRLRFSFKEKESLKRLIYWHMRPGCLADQEKPSARAIYRFFRDTQEEGIGVLLLSIADWRATRGPLVDKKKRRKHERVLFTLIARYFKEKEKVPCVLLVDGYDIMRKFGLSPSPLVGVVLKRIKEEQALGTVHTKQQAFRIARIIVAKGNQKYKKK